jgi:hypothetical protein
MPRFLRKCASAVTLRSAVASPSSALGVVIAQKITAADALLAFVAAGLVRPL